MLNQIKSKLSDPEFQRQAAQAGGQVVSFVATVIVSQLISKAVTIGINAVMDKIQNTETPAE